MQPYGEGKKKKKKEKNLDLRSELGGREQSLCVEIREEGKTMIDCVVRERENSNVAEEENWEVICVICGFVHLYFFRRRKSDTTGRHDPKKRRNGQHGAILQSSARSLILLLSSS